MNLCGQTTLVQLAQVFNNCLMALVNDSAPMHLASYVDVPVLALFGPTNPGRTGPHGSGSRVVSIQESCAPCYKRSCPKGRECMEPITVADVMSAWDYVKTLDV